MANYIFNVVNDVYFIPQSKMLISKSNKIIKYSTHHTIYTDDVIFCETIDNVKIMNEKVITITFWHLCYGHLLDSLYNLYSFWKNNKTYTDYKILLVIPLYSKNIIDLANYLFKDKFINSFDLPQIIEFNEVVLVQNHGECNYFFKYQDEDVKEHIRNYYNNNDCKQYENVFLTRSINSGHDAYSVLSNLKYIVDFFILHNFTIIDPQHISDIELYNNIKHAKNIITTNGSALCPLITLNNPNVKIFCLNSNRYLPKWRQSCKNENEVVCKEDFMKKTLSEAEINHENFEKNLWRAVTSKFNFTYIDSYENVITDQQLDYIIKNIN